MTRCRGTTKTGGRCRAEASAGSDYCWRHAPDEPAGPGSDEDVTAGLSGQARTALGLLIAGV
ncbi:MAG: hypothetical protein D6701_00845, partial [Gemmatimonadetes bacterium]